MKRKFSQVWFALIAAVAAFCALTRDAFRAAPDAWRYGTHGLALLFAPVAMVGIVGPTPVGPSGPLDQGNQLAAGTGVPAALWGTGPLGAITQPTNPAQALVAYSLGQSCIAVYASTQSPAEVAANTSEEKDFTVTGVAAGSVVHVMKPTTQAGLGVGSARVKSANTVAVTFFNVTGAGITPTASQQYRVIEFRGPLVQTAALTPSSVPAATSREQKFTITPASGKFGLSSARLGYTTGVTNSNPTPPIPSPLGVGVAPGAANQTPALVGLPQTVIVNKPTLNAGVAIGGVRVSDNNQLAVTYVNPTAAAVEPTAETYSFVALRGVTLHSPVITYIVDVGTLAEVATITAAQQTVTVHGLAAGDVVLGVDKPTDQAGIGLCESRVTAANTLGLKFVNPTAGGVTPTADQHYAVTVLKANAGMGAVLTQFSAVITPVAVAADTGAEQTFTVSGLVTDCPIAINAGAGAAFASALGEALPAGLAIGGARVSATDTLAINFVNASGASVTPGTLLVTILQAPLDRSGGVAGVDGSAVLYPIDNRATQLLEQFTQLWNALYAMAGIRGS